MAKEKNMVANWVPYHTLDKVTAAVMLPFVFVASKLDCVFWYEGRSVQWRKERAGSWWLIFTLLSSLFSIEGTENGDRVRNEIWKK